MRGTGADDDDDDDGTAVVSRLSVEVPTEERTGARLYSDTPRREFFRIAR